jgi:acetylornithine deacetylase/succinyl-diaminopimelate desuccinylase-like protein
VRAAVEKAVADYCARYGDKTKEADPATGKPKVDHHYDLIPVKAKKGLLLAIHGKAGHMGAVLECDGAITKMAYIVRELGKIGTVSLHMADPQKDEPWGDPRRPLVELALEGGQGFLPTHDIFEIQKRIVKAAAAGAKEYCKKMGVAFKDAMVRTTFDKLHNDAFARKPDSPAMKAAVYAAKKAGLWKGEPIVGWNVSCDARIFAKQFPKREVVTFGPGSLTYAHSPQEQMDVREIVATAKMMAIYALALCGWEKMK